MKNKLWIKLIADILLTGILLGLFYLTNYVLPKQYEAEAKIISDENIAVNDPNDIYFSDTITTTENSYTSDDISLSIET
ncbi:MAG TPA: hypothetical protein PLX66_01160, partial [Bacilli bacterium]|nr:hypothetical protein [Bacilli bacterium]